MNELFEPSVSHATRTMKDGVSEMKDAVVDKTTRAARHCRNGSENMIKRAPYASVVVAFGIGALASALLFRRK